MADYQRYSRAERHKKRKSSKQKIMFFGMLAVVFCILLFSFIVFGNKETPPSEKETATTETEKTETETNEDKDSNDNAVKEDNGEETEDPLLDSKVEDRVEAIDPEANVETKEVASDDSNVKKAYTGNWKPIGTNQEGPHTTNYDENSDDRIEIRKAVSQVTDVEESNMIEHWIGNGGDQKVVATIQDQTNSSFYRVYLEWVNDKGWKPTKVEELKNYNGEN